MTTTLYASLLRLAGLSQREAAAFHGVRIDTVKSWSAGRNAVPEGVMDQLHELIDRQSEAADNLVQVIEGQGHPPTEIGYCTDDHEAQQFGWPSAGAHWAMIARAWEQLPTDMDLRVVPRGSTPATAAAIQAREQRR